ncbi:MAG: glycoside hydrolase family 105 protein [Terriglobia bacterium]
MNRREHLAKLLTGGLVVSPWLRGVTPAATPRDKWISVADDLLTTPAESYEFDWGEGVLMCGLMQTYKRTKSEKYADFAARWADAHLPKGIERLLGNQPGTDRVGYCGHWVCGTALLYLYAARAKPEYLRTASEIGAFVRAGATRSPEGAIGHWVGNYQIWVDTLDMTCPLLSRLSRVENKPDYIDDAVNQLLIAARHMRDPQTGLFYHMWDWQFDRRSPEQWGRGNGWVAMSLADTFEFLPKNHPRYRELKGLAESYARSLLTAQDADGVWHTLINDQASPAECSATTMICYGLLKLARLGVLPVKYREAAMRGWEAVNARWVKDGKVVGVSEGTGPESREQYLERKMGTYTWGTGSYLMAGAEADRLHGARSAKEG